MFACLNLLMTAATGGEESAQPYVPPVPTDWAIVTTFVTAGLSLLLVVAFVLMLVFRRRGSPAARLTTALRASVTAALDLKSAPSVASVRRLRKSIRKSSSCCDMAIYRGLVEVKPAQVLLTEAANVCKCIVVTKSESDAAKFADLLLAQAEKALEIAAPYDPKEADDSIAALNTVRGASAYLEATRARHGIENIEQEERREEASDPPAESGEPKE